MNKNFYLHIFWITLGGILFLLASMNILTDFYTGFGGGFLAVGILQLIRDIRYRTNSDYKEAVDIANNDERNHFLRMKAWSYAGYFTILICAGTVIVCMILGQTLYMKLFSYIICGITLLYWISYMVLSKKY